ncbi:MAG: hypothetical protein JWO67_3276 [Streptosporangiaceae bacterium]|nr:hypothetical protein [Streptosporangiaceae bacterium]
MTLPSPEYWEAKADELSRTGLDTIRASAAGWAATTTVLLGLAGTVTLVKAPETVEKIDLSVRGFVVACSIAAVVLAFFSVASTARASRGFPKRFRPLNGIQLAQWHKQEAGQARAWLAFGKLTGMLAAVLLLLASVISLLASASGDVPPRWVLVRTDGGAVQCGELQRDGTNLVLDHNGNRLLALDHGIATTTVVDSCP